MSEHVSDSAEWQAVQGHAEKFSTVHLRDLFDNWGGFYSLVHLSNGLIVVRCLYWR